MAFRIKFREEGEIGYDLYKIVDADSVEVQDDHFVFWKGVSKVGYAPCDRVLYVEQAELDEDPMPSNTATSIESR